MRNPLLLVLLASLGLAPALPALGQSSSGTRIQVFVSTGSGHFIANTGGAQFVRPGSFVTADATRRGDPVVFMDRVSSGPSSDELLHVSVYASGLVTVSSARFSSSSSEDVDFGFVSRDEVAALRQALTAAGAPRLHGLLPGSGAAPASSQSTTVTFFQPNRALRARPFSANSFSFGPDVLDPRATRVEDLIEDFVDDF